MSTFWVLVEQSQSVLALGALIALGIALGLAIVAWRRVPGRRIGVGVGAGMGCLAVPVLLFIAVCTPPPGRGAISEARYREANGIRADLERFRLARGGYPDSLRALLTLPPADSVAPSSYRDSLSHFSYQRDSLGYVLRFAYFGPGKNYCELHSVDGRWSCSGLF